MYTFHIKKVLSVRCFLWLLGYVVFLNGEYMKIHLWIKSVVFRLCAFLNGDSGN